MTRTRNVLQCIILLTYQKLPSVEILSLNDFIVHNAIELILYKGGIIERDLSEALDIPSFNIENIEGLEKAYSHDPQTEVNFYFSQIVEMLKQKVHNWKKKYTYASKFYLILCSSVQTREVIYINIYFLPSNEDVELDEIPCWVSCKILSVVPEKFSVFLYHRCANQPTIDKPFQIFHFTQYFSPPVFAHFMYMLSMYKKFVN